MNSELIFLIGIMGLSWLVVILSIAFTPYFIRKNISFGVSVPENEYDNPSFKGLRRTYAIGCLVVGLILAAASSLCYLWITVETAVWIQLAAIFLYLGISVLFYFSMRKKVKAIKLESDWPIDAKAVAELSGEKASGKTLHTGWYLLYLVVIAAAIIAVILKYPSLPDQIPMHYNIAGEVDRYAPKTIGVFAVMPIIQLLIGMMFAGINVAIRTSKRQRDFNRSSAFRGVLSVTLFAIGFMVMLLMTCVQLTMLDILNEKMMIFLPIGFLIVITAICVFLAVKVGQGGSRLKGAYDQPAVTVDDDSHWVGGFLYFNKKDPSVFVEKRFGIGYTLNFGNPISMLVGVGLLVLIAVLLILPLVIK